MESLEKYIGMNHKPYCKNIKILLTELLKLGLTWRDLKEKVGINPNTLSGWYKYGIADMKLASRVKEFFDTVSPIKPIYQAVPAENLGSGTVLVPATADDSVSNNAVLHLQVDNHNSRIEILVEEDKESGRVIKIFIK